MKIKDPIKRVFHKTKKFFLELSLVNGLVIVVLLVILFFIFMRGYGDESHVLDNWLGTDEESNAKYRTLRLLALLLAGMVGFFISNRRAKAMENQAKAQTKSVEEQVKVNENKTFHEAIKHLGDSSASVRLGGIYALYDLALSNPEKRLKNIIEILSAHVRTTTQEDEYQKKYKTKPSNEISSLLKLLSDLNTNYLSENEEEGPFPLDLSYAYLCGLMLSELDFRKALFVGSNFAHAKLLGSYFEGAELISSHFEGAELISSHFASAYLEESNFEGANLYKSNFEGAYFSESHFEGAYFSESHFEGAYFSESHFAGAYLSESHFEGAESHKTHFEGAILEYSNFFGAILEGSHFEGASLWGSDFAGANLYASHFGGAELIRSHFEGANLSKSHFEGAALRESHFEGANLRSSHFKGAYDDQDEDIDNFMDRIEKRTEKKAEIGKTMIFAGGITEEYMKDFKERVKNTSLCFTYDDWKEKFNKRMNEMIEVLKTHQDQPVSHEIPERLKNNIFLGELTKERADEIIKQYEEIMKIHDEIKKKNK